MEHTFQDGAVIATGKMFEDVVYDVSNHTISASFDGKGGISYYFIANGASFNAPIRFISICYNGKMQDVLLDKKVTLIGRKQTIELNLQTAVLKIEQFLDTAGYGVYTAYQLLTENANDTVEIAILGNIADGRKTLRDTVLIGENSILESNTALTYVQDNHAVYFRLTGEQRTVWTKMTYGTALTETCDLSADCAQAYARMEKELAATAVPAGLSDMETALYHSAYWCSLENYKENDEFKGFMAGCRYLSPMRTYYRDSYYTVLPMYKQHADFVRTEIITLARGISADGACPSAVYADFSAHWGDHYDSPSFIAMMLYDYVSYTKDLSVIDAPAGEKTVLEKVLAAFAHLSSYTDDTGLLYKAGRYNQRDWADEVNRYGYVTYDELLFARAAFCIAQLFRLKGQTAEYERYMAQFEKIKTAINDILWSEEKGYYVNFTNEDYTEDNLSIDTVFAAIFDIADSERAKKLLTRMEELLETPNNGINARFGSMCVYPFYKTIQSARNKSTQSFDYHNGANWPYLSAMYAYAKRKFGMSYKHLLTIPFTYNLERGNYTLLEYFSPYCKDGSLLQAWSGAIAFVLDEEISTDFWAVR